MPLLEVTQTRHLSASIRLTDSTAVLVDQYAAFIKASPDDVVDKALGYVFSKDRDFQDFLRTDAARSVPSLLRVRKSPVVPETSTAPKKPAAAVRPTESAAVRQA